MAKIISENIVVSFSKIVKDSTSEAESLVSDEVLSALEQVAQELVGDSVIVEVVKP